ncbi:hypothetical protein [Lysinibacillus sp. JNUCC-52]|uniref:hypothetical protein n=1 Tax=Lysinibacillus sp. JNUCC-52 TaxID=2792480 RepID=UPI001937B8CD|nr:hypothetical protein JNUCC52_00725 [Lysinibacillus sp. JNUCC-52]
MKHNPLHQWQKEHNMLIKDFHKKHALELENGVNGDGLLARWERFVYSKGKAFLKAVK